MNKHFKMQLIVGLFMVSETEIFDFAEFKIIESNISNLGIIETEQLKYFTLL